MTAPVTGAATLMVVLSAGAGVAHAQWSGLGSGGAIGGPVRGLAVLPNGDLVAAGGFGNIGGVTASSIARWNGNTWSPIGPTPTIQGTVHSVACTANGDIFATGTFGFGNGIARWNGSAWSSLSGIGLENQQDGRSVATRDGSTVVVGGAFTFPGRYVASWNGSTWSSLSADTNGWVFAVACLANGDVIAGGDFTQIGGVGANRIARWNGTMWSALGSGTNSGVFALVPLPAGELIVGGAFTVAGGVGANRVARWNASGWSAVGPGIASGPVDALAVLPAGDIVAGGRFTTAGGGPGDRIARWDGAVWSPLGAGMDGDVMALAVMPSGYLVAGGQFSRAGSEFNSPSIARWYLAPVVTQSPSNAAVCAAGTASVTVAASGAQLAYAWRRDTTPLANGATGTGSVISGANSPQLQIANFSGADAASYDCVVTNSAGAATSAPAALTLAGAPGVAVQPVAGGYFSGQRLVMYVAGVSLAPGAVGGSSAPALQWRRNGVPLSDGVRISGSTGAILVIDPLQNGDVGSYDVVVSGCGMTTTAAAALSVTCYANCDESTQAPILNVADFTCFLQRYSAGCP